MKRIVMAGVFLVVASLACSSLGSTGTRCQEDFIDDVNCSGLIGNLDGTETVTASAARLAQGTFEADILVSVDSGTVLVSFTDADGNTVSQEVSEGGSLTGTAGITDESFAVTFQSEGGPASQVSYTISLNEVEP